MHSLAASAPPRPDPKPAKPQADDAKPKGKAKGKGGQGDAVAKPRQPTAAQPAPAGVIINPAAHLPLSEIRTLLGTWPWREATDSLTYTSPYAQYAGAPAPASTSS